MFYQIMSGLTVPFIGTTVGSAFVFFIKKRTLNLRVQTGLSFFAAGIMTAASVWSLIIPSYEMAKEGFLHPVILPVIGFWSGIFFIFLADKVTSRVRKTSKNPLFMTAFTVALHNLPEGMAVGAVYAGLITGDTSVNFAQALALCIGIACQNVPEGAIISVPLYSHGTKRKKAFILGFLSGVAEPVGMILTLILAKLIIPALPWFLSFAAGAMIYAVTGELVPMQTGRTGKNFTVFCFALGFSVMMSLDMAL